MTITRTFIVYDLCGNSATCDQTITIDDTTDPTITCPTDLALEACTTADITTVTGGSTLAYSETIVTITLAQYLAETGAASG